MSDLHLEFNRVAGDFNFPAHFDDYESTLILAGDIDLAKHVHKFLALCSERFKYVLYVFGNHEFYKANYPQVYKKIDDNIAHLPNVYILDEDVIVLDGVFFVGATLWTDMDKGNPLLMSDAEYSMNDYNCIRTGPVNAPWQRKLKPVETMALHRRQRDFIFDQLRNAKNIFDKTVVVSHHLPSYMCIADEHQGSPLNGAYASELHPEMMETQPDLWVHGHTHSSNDIMVPDSKTRIVCNPRGYWPHELNEKFDVNLRVEL
jgi:UDP-2,3-diacylglucosamine pyrophosphatase LpxH|tara:strand:+ start:829 stop:1608 length:780 start_codon:yes stop_codon:yes gene_type:complete